MFLLLDVKGFCTQKPGFFRETGFLVLSLYATQIWYLPKFSASRKWFALAAGEERAKKTCPDDFP